MGRRIKIKLQDTTPARVIHLDPDATVGASLGVNLFLPDGQTVGTPATVKEWLGLTDAIIKQKAAAAGVQAHRLLTGLTLGNDHPQYPLKAGVETISGQWNFTAQMRVADGTAAAPGYSWESDRDTGIYRIGANNFGFATGGTYHWDISTTLVAQDIPLTITNYGGLFIQNPDYTHAGLELTTITGLDPHNNGIGNQIAFWEVGTGGAFTDRSYGFRIRHAGEVNTEGNLDWYRHSNDTTGVLFLRMRRNSSQIFGADGSAAEPLWSFISDTDTGMYLAAGTNQLGFSVAGTERLLINGSTGVDASTPYRTAAGTNALPAFTFTSDANTGIYRVGSDNLGVTTGGTLRWDVSTTAITSTLPLRGADGAVGAPQYSWSGDTDTGIYRITADQFGFATGGVLRLDIAAARITATVPYLQIAGVVGTPGLAIVGDENTGVWSPGADSLAFSTGGTERLRFGSAGQWGLAGANYGTAGQVLTSNGVAAAPTWEDGGSGSGIVDSIVEGEGIIVHDYDPANPEVAVDIFGLPSDASPVGSTDYVMTYDFSTGLLKKVLIDDLPSSGGGTVDSVIGTAFQIDVNSVDPANPIVSLASGVLTALVLASTAVQPTRTLTAGAGLTGGGDLSADRTFDVGAGTGITVNANDVALSAATITSLGKADTAVQPARQIISGGGLTGGGDLSADRTLVVGAGTGITVNADDVQVSAAYQSLINGAIQASLLTTNGDIIIRSAGAPARLGIGTEGYVLSVVSGAPAWAAGGGSSGQVVTYSVYTANDTWTKPSGFNFGMAIGIGQGGGGGSGRLGVAGSGRVGGGGGGGAGRAVVNFTDADVGATAAVVVNGAGVGGAARSVTAQDGANGTTGTTTTFGSLLSAGGGTFGTGGTNSGNAPAGTGGVGNAGNGAIGGTGYAVTITTPGAVPGGSTGAGGGAGAAGVTTGNAGGTSTAGGDSAGASGGTAGAAAPAAGGTGGSVGATYNTGGGGGGGSTGSTVSTTVGGAGGVGGQWGGGGGGGSGSTLLVAAGASGAGGNGGSGVLIVISWCNIGAGTGLMDSVVAGTGITVNSADPINPTVSVDQAFAPTWTNNHIWSGTAPQNSYIETDAAADNQRWRWLANGTAFALQTRDDANSAGNNCISFDRSGTTCTTATIGSSAQDTVLALPSVNDAVTPTLTFLSDLDTGLYRIGANNIGFAANGLLVSSWGDGVFTLATAIRETGIISPAQIAANTDNYNPSGLASCSIMRLNTDASRNLTGIVAQASGIVITIFNVGAQNLVLKHDVTSTAANRFLCPNSADLTLNANDSANIWYDTTSARWRVVGI